MEILVVRLKDCEANGPKKIICIVFNDLDGSFADAHLHNELHSEAMQRMLDTAST